MTMSFERGEGVNKKGVPDWAWYITWCIMGAGALLNLIGLLMQFQTIWVPVWQCWLWSNSDDLHEHGFYPVHRPKREGGGPYLWCRLHFQVSWSLQAETYRGNDQSNNARSAPTWTSGHMVPRKNRYQESLHFARSFLGSPAAKEAGWFYRSLFRHVKAKVKRPFLGPT